MIRPVTCLCMILAAGSGMYLYQAKHRSQLLDERIAGILNNADANRAHMQILRAEYQLLQDPGRLGDLATAHLALTKTDSKQFINWAALEKIIPVSIAPPPPIDVPPPVIDTPVAALAPAASSRVAGTGVGIGATDPAAARTTVATLPQHPSTPVQTTARSATAASAPIASTPLPSTGSHTLDAVPTVVASTTIPPRPSASISSLGMAHPDPSSAATLAQARIRAVQPPPVPQSVVVAQHRYQYQPAPYGYQPPPATSAELLARLGRGGGSEPAAPAVASALGMARTMPGYVTPTNVSTWIPNGSGG